MPTLWVALLTIVLLLNPADEGMVDNPEFKSWAAHAVGTSAVMEASINFDGNDRAWEQTCTLVKTDAEACTVEVRESQLPQPWTRQVMAKTKQGTEYLPDDFDGTAKFAGQEIVFAAGRNYDCKVIAFECPLVGGIGERKVLDIRRSTRAGRKSQLCDHIS